MTKPKEEIIEGETYLDGHHIAFVLDDNRYFARIWQADGEGGAPLNVLAMVWRLPDGPWHGRVRLRFIVDDKVFNSKDRRKIMDIKGMDAGDAERDRICATIEQVFTALEAAFQMTVQRVEVNGTGHKAMDALTRLPNMHMRDADSDAPYLEDLPTKGVQ